MIEKYFQLKSCCPHHFESFDIIFYQFPLLLVLMLRVYGGCGSRNYRRFGRRATDMKNGNAGPKLHWLVWEKSSFPALPCEQYFLAENKGLVGDIGPKGKNKTFSRLQVTLDQY